MPLQQPFQTLTCTKVGSLNPHLIRLPHIVTCASSDLPLLWIGQAASTMAEPGMPTLPAHPHPLAYHDACLLPVAILPHLPTISTLDAYSLDIWSQPALRKVWATVSLPLARTGEGQRLPHL